MIAIKNRIKIYSIYGIPIKVSYPIDDAYREIPILFKEISFVKDSYKNKINQKCILINISGKYQPLPRTYDTLIHSYLSEIKLFNKANTFFYASGHSLFVVYPRKNLATLYLNKGTLLNHERFSLRKLIVVGLLELLRWKGLYTMHACGISKGNLQLLLIGNNGSGKSTVAMNMISRGWRFLSDDSVFLKEVKNQISVFSVSSELKLKLNWSYNSALAPKLKKHVKECLIDGDKLTVDLGKVYPGTIISKFIPNVILSLKIVGYKESVLQPIKKRAALLKLVNQSISLFFGGEPSQKQLNLLTRLLSQAIPYQLLMGRDLYENPGKISEIVSSIK